MLTMVVCDWIQLPVVEPDIEKVKFKTQQFKQGNEFQLQSPDEIGRIKVNLVSEKNSNISSTYANISKGITQNISTTTTTLGNHRTNLKATEYSPLSSASFSTTGTTISPTSETTKNFNEITILTTEWPYDSILETEASSVQIPHIHVHLKTNLNSQDTEKGSLLYKTRESQSEVDALDTKHDINIFLQDGRLTKNKPMQTVNKTEDLNTHGSKELPLDMLKAVHQTLVQKTPHTIKGKVQFLQQLQNRMMSYMGKYIYISVTILYI